MEKLFHGWIPYPFEQGGDRVPVFQPSEPILGHRAVTIPHASSSKSEVAYFKFYTSEEPLHIFTPRFMSSQLNLLTTQVNSTALWSLWDIMGEGAICEFVFHNDLLFRGDDRLDFIFFPLMELWQFTDL